jgi:RNA polymerase sigma factor (TIGR02999 family)
MTAPQHTCPEIEIGALDADRLFPIVYKELRALAASMMAHERHGHTLQPTALVHEAYERLVGGGPITVESRRHFFNAAALAMRRVLIDHARRHRAQRRGGGRAKLPLESIEIPATRHFRIENSEDVEAIEEAMAELGEQSPRLVETIHLRLYLGLTIEQTAEVLGVSASTVKNDARFAIAWLKERVRPENASRDRGFRPTKALVTTAIRGCHCSPFSAQQCSHRLRACPKARLLRGAASRGTQRRELPLIHREIWSRCPPSSSS